MIKFIVCGLLITALFISGCKQEEEINVDKMLAEYKQDNKAEIVECYNQNNNNAEGFCHCLGGYAVYNYPANNKIFCGNTQIELPYVEISKILS